MTRRARRSTFATSRKPLAGEFRYLGRPVFVIANHFNSKGGDQPLLGRFQPPVRSSETQRHAQATIVHDFVEKIRRTDPLATAVVAGDLNDFEFSQTADILVGDGWLTDLPRKLPEAERYTYVFDGQPRCSTTSWSPARRCCWAPTTTWSTSTPSSPTRRATTIRGSCG